MRFLSLLLLCMCACVVGVVMCSGRLWSVCEVVLVPYVDAMVVVSVVRVLLFLLQVCMQR